MLMENYEGNNCGCEIDLCTIVIGGTVLYVFIYMVVLLAMTMTFLPLSQAEHKRECSPLFSTRVEYILPAKPVACFLTERIGE